MATRQRGIAAKNDRSFDRETVRRNATEPSGRAPWSWKTFFARSRPMMLTSSMDASPLVAGFDNHDLGTRCRRRGVHPIGVGSERRSARQLVNLLRKKGSNSDADSTNLCIALIPCPDQSQTGASTSSNVSQTQYCKPIDTGVHLILGRLDFQI